MRPDRYVKLCEWELYEKGRSPPSPLHNEWLCIITHPGWSGDDHVVTRLDPLAGGQGEERGTIQTPGVAKVHILHAGRLLEPGLLKAPGQPSSRRSASRSTSRPKRFSNESAPVSGWESCSSSAWAIPASFIWCSLSRVCCSTGFTLLIVVIPAPDVGVCGDRFGWFWIQGHLVQSGLQDRVHAFV